MTEAIAIDFGTTRTKVAYWDERTHAPRLVHLGYGDKPHVPSLFHLSRDSEQISWGYDAEELLEEDPAGIVEVLKRHLQDRYVYASRRKVSPKELLTLMFGRLREQAGQEVLALSGTPPVKACLTLPALYGPAVEKLLREAAQAAEFTDVELIPEPVAAAQAWLAEAGETGRSVVVLDCGGGTLDLAYLVFENGQFRIIPECPPGGDTHVGGHDVDRELLNLLREQLPDAAEELEQRQSFYLRQARVLKERYCRSLPVRPLNVAGQTLELSPEDIQTVLQERFIAQTCESLKAYLGRVVTLTGGEIPPVLLVGGSAQIKGLKEAIEAQDNFRTLWWERSEFATVLGAVSAPVVGELPPSPRMARDKTRLVEKKVRTRRAEMATAKKKVVAKKSVVKKTAKKKVVAKKAVSKKTRGSVLRRQKKTDVTLVDRDATQTLYVSLSGPTDLFHYRSLRQAVDEAPDGAVIKVAPGVYHENIVINKPILIESEDTQNKPRLVPDKNTVCITNLAINAKLRGLDLRPSTGAIRSFVGGVVGTGIKCLDGRLSVENCKISSSRGAGINLMSGFLDMKNCDIKWGDVFIGCYKEQAETVFRGCTFKWCNSGLHIGHQGAASLFDCNILNNTDGIVILDGGTATLEGCSIYRNKDTAVHVYGHLIAQDCRINNNRAGIRVDSGASARVVKCDLTKNGDGIANTAWVLDLGHGEVEDVDNRIL